ncbi:MAG: sigma-70 family RNA polymerase sigma factor [Rikenellaceae bacterium]|nr:sigma-70 family RNA polymerase sigma factor [Rikenellaceae bacterium]
MMENREFEIFVQRTRGEMYRTACRYLSSSDEAEDVVQDALVKLYTIRHRLDEGRSVEALARVIVRNMAIDTLRQRARHPIIPMHPDLSDDGRIEVDERHAELLRVIETLPSKQQLILRMKHIDGMEVEEIAQTLQMNIDAVYQNLSRARRAVLNKFKKS